MMPAHAARHARYDAATLSAMLMAAAGARELMPPLEECRLLLMPLLPALCALILHFIAICWLPLPHAADAASLFLFRFFFHLFIFFAMSVILFRRAAAYFEIELFAALCRHFDFICSSPYAV